MSEKLKCPRCGAELDRVCVISKCWQYAHLGDDGKLRDFDSVEEVMDTQDVECRECGVSIRHLVKGEE